MNKPCLFALGLAALVLAGCGGDDDPPAAAGPPAAAEVPQSAGASAEALTQFITQLAGTDNDTKEALDLAKFKPPSSEVTEPLALR